MSSKLIQVAIVLTLGAFFSGCTSSTVGTGISKEEKPFASALVKNSSRERVERAVVEVFTDEGFDLVSSRNGVHHFTKRGDKASAALYGTSWSTTHMTIEPRVTVKNLGGGAFDLQCEVTMVEHIDSLVGEGARHDLIRRGKRAYTELLERAKARAEET